MDFMGRNKVALGQTDLKLDIYKANPTALPSQRLVAANHLHPHAQIILYAEGRRQQNKSIFWFIFPGSGD